MQGVSLTLHIWHYLLYCSSCFVNEIKFVYLGNGTAARGALLGSITSFKKDKLKKTVTVDKSKPKL